MGLALPLPRARGLGALGSWQRGSGHLSSAHGACRFLFGSQEAAWTVTDECIQIMGGMGFMKVSSRGGKPT